VLTRLPRQLPSSDYGLFVWPSAILLAEFLSYHRTYFRGKRVVELGAGVGLAGIVAAKIGAAGTPAPAPSPQRATFMQRAASFCAPA